MSQPCYPIPWQAHAYAHNFRLVQNSLTCEWKQLKLKRNLKLRLEARKQTVWCHGDLLASFVFGIIFILIIISCCGFFCCLFCLLVASSSTQMTVSCYLLSCLICLPCHNALTHLFACLSVCFGSGSLCLSVRLFVCLFVCLLACLWFRLCYLFNLLPICSAQQQLATHPRTCLHMFNMPPMMLHSAPGSMSPSS